MNERIKELADRLWRVHPADIDALGLKSRTEFYEQELKKFAELIVRECADICINENVSNIDMKVMRESGKFTVQDLATKSCGENLAKRIKEHFGVEE